MKSPSTATARNLWVGLMTIASTVTTLVLACATPFPALAALAATHVRRTEGLILMAAAWVASQAVGFCLLGYSLTANSFAWAAALGMAAVGSLLSAEAATRWLARANPVARLTGSYVAAYVGFKAVILVWAFALDGGWAAFSPDVLLRQFIRYGAILLGLIVFHKLLGVAGLRGVRGPSAAT